MHLPVTVKEIKAGYLVTSCFKDIYLYLAQNKLPSTGGSHLSHTAVKPDSHLAQIFVVKFLCIIKLIIIIG